MVDTREMRAAASGVLVAAGVVGVYGTLVSSVSSVANSAPNLSASCRPYVVQSDVISLILGASAAVLARNWAPFVATLVVVIYMHALYEYAIQNGANTSAKSF